MEKEVIEEITRTETVSGDTPVVEPVTETEQDETEDISEWLTNEFAALSSAVANQQTSILNLQTALGNLQTTLGNIQTILQNLPESIRPILSEAISPLLTLQIATAETVVETMEETPPTGSEIPVENPPTEKDVEDLRGAENPPEPPPARKRQFRRI